VLKVTSIEAIRSDQVRVTVYEDPKAINRTLRVYNTFDVQARDSLLVLGESPVPPGEYIGFNLAIEPGSTVILNGYIDIPIKRLPGFDPTLRFRTPYSVREEETTTIVITVNLDSTLVRGVDFATKRDIYYFKPYYYISSISYH